MYGTVKLRNERNYNDDKTKDRPLSGSLYLSRPKSWGEFQSGLSTFHSVPRPRKSTSSEEPEPIQVETKPASKNGAIVCCYFRRLPVLCGYCKDYFNSK